MTLVRQGAGRRRPKTDRAPAERRRILAGDHSFGVEWLLGQAVAYVLAAVAPLVTRGAAECCGMVAAVLHALH